MEPKIKKERNKMEEEKRILSPKIDVVFKMIFGVQEHEKITKKLLEDVLGEEIEEVELENTPYLMGDHIDDKIGIIDVKAKINNRSPIDLEMQVLNNHDIEKRVLFYWSKLYLSQIKKGERYKKLERSINIVFLDYEIERFKNLPVHTKWQIRNNENGKIILTEELEIHIIELPKIRKKEVEERLRKWIIFLNNPGGEEIRKMAEEEKEIKEAMDILEDISSDEERLRIAELREKYIMDRESEMETAREIGLEEGRKEGLKQGLEEGRAEGREEGREEGKAEGIKEGQENGVKQATVDIVKKMIEENIDIKLIEKITGLTKGQIEKIKKEK